MKCTDCKFFGLLEGCKKLGFGNCHLAPGKVFVINGQIETYHPQAMTDDPACKEFVRLENQS